MGIQLDFKEREGGYGLDDIRSFRDELIRGLTDICGPEFEVAARDVRKNNGVMLYGISISEEGSSIAPTIYTESLHTEYLRGTMNLREAENEIIRAYSKEKANYAPDLDFISDFEKIREKITFRLINAERNAELLSDVPHRRFLDMAVVYTVYIEGFFSGAGNVMVKNDLMDHWNTDEETLYALALENTPEIKGPEIRDLSEVVATLMCGSEEECREMVKELDRGSGFSMYILTNSDKFYGDAVVLYPGFLEGVRKKLKKDFYMLPSSVHEFIIVPEREGMDHVELMKMVQDVNSSAVSREDFLSDNVYIYKDGRMTVCQE